MEIAVSGFGVTVTTTVDTILNLDGQEHDDSYV